jgi:cyclophilin family peptidyl-prolyl cis-trans isomerase/HEAT repeat protein
MAPTKLNARTLAALALAAVALAPSSASAATPRSTTAEDVAADTDVVLRAHASILRAEDERNAQDSGISRALLSPSAPLRLRAVRALGRIGDPASVRLVASSCADRDRSVQREAVFALGEMESPAALTPLSQALRSEDTEQRALAAEALAKIAWPDDAQRHQAWQLVVNALLQRGQESDTSVVARALRASWRFGAGAPGLVEATSDAFLRPESEISEAAAYAAARLGEPRLGNLYELFMRDDRPAVRALGCAGMRRITAGEAGAAARTPDRRQALLRRAFDVDRGVRLVAIPTLAAFEPVDAVHAQEFLDVSLRTEDSELQRAALLLVKSWKLTFELPSVQRIVQGPRRDLQEEACAALMALQGEAALEALGNSARSADWTRRAAVARALTDPAVATSKPAAEMLGRLLADADPRVEEAALEAITEAHRADAAVIALAHLGAKDVVVRAIAASALPDLVGDALPKEEAVAALRRAWAESASDVVPDARVAALEGLTEILGAGAAPDLLRAASQPDWTLRLKAHSLLEKVHVPAPPLGTAALGRPLQYYVDAASDELAAPRRLLRFQTSAGAIDVELATADAPLTVRHLERLADAGFFDGLTFHRVVGGFVAQGGCPRGDGWGGPNESLRCEINRRPFDRGAAGMALSGKDTGGSQFFFTLAPAPHLDGGYTVWGHVTPETMSAVDSLRRFDVIERAYTVRGSSALAVAEAR